MSEVKEKKTVVTIPEVKEILEKVDSDDLDQLQKRTLDYLLKFSKTSGSEAKSIRKALVKDCGLTEEEAAELVNSMPTSIEELRVFTSGWKKLILTETAEKILKLLAGK
ncbi:MAG: RNA polymerase Rpb4 [Nitrososphaerales archaeon]